MDCIFCKIVKGEIPSVVVDETPHVMTFMSIEGHPLVVTKKHIENIYEMDNQLGAEVMKEAIKISQAIKKGLKADGVNLVQNNERAAHQSVFHFHLHIKPRWEDDGLVISLPDVASSEEERKQTADKIRNVL